MTETPPARALAFFAHPDDPEFMAGGTLAKWVEEGVAVTIVILTDGSAGSNDPNQDLVELVSIRQAEERAAAAALGVQEVLFLGHKDGELTADLALRRELTRLIRQYRPDRVVCNDPTMVIFGDDYINHPDHRAAGEATLYAVFPSSETRPIFPELLGEGLEPHKVKELWLGATDKFNTHVDITATLEKKIDSLRAHVSQVQVGDGQWIKEWAQRDGEAAGLAYAESFRVMRLMRDDPQTEAVSGGEAPAAAIGE